MTAECCKSQFGSISPPKNNSNLTRKKLWPLRNQPPFGIISQLLPTNNHAAHLASQLQNKPAWTLRSIMPPMSNETVTVFKPLPHGCSPSPSPTYLTAHISPFLGKDWHAEQVWCIHDNTNILNRCQKACNNSGMTMWHHFMLTTTSILMSMTKTAQNILLQPALKPSLCYSASLIYNTARILSALIKWKKWLSIVHTDSQAIHQRSLHGPHHSTGVYSFCNK